MHRISFPVRARANVLVVGTVKVLGTEVRGPRWESGARAVADEPTRTATTINPAATVNADALRLALLLISNHQDYARPARTSHQHCRCSIGYRLDPLADWAARRERSDECWDR